MQRDLEKELCHAVAGWLAYKSLTGMRRLIKEDSVTVPVAEYLAANTRNVVVREVDHPGFESQSRGRPRQVDYVIKRRGGSGWLDVIECKYLPDTPQRIIDDIMRLVTLKSDDKIGNPTRYLLIAGEVGEQSTPLRREINLKKGTPRENLLDHFFKEGEIGDEHLVQVGQLPERIEKMVVSFGKAYGTDVPSMIRTTLVGRAHAHHFSCALWKMNWRRGASAYPIA